MSGRDPRAGLCYPEPAPAAGVAEEGLILYRAIQSAPLTMREAHLVRLIKGAIRKESAWGEDFTATELADRSRALSGACATPSELMCLFRRVAKLSRS